MKKNILITGASSGIGKSIAYLFAAHGWNLILTGRREDRLEEIKTDLSNRYNTYIQCLTFDVRDAVATQQALASIDRTQFPHIDVLVNNAGLAAGFGSIDTGDYDDWNRMIDTNVKGLLHVSREMIPRFKEQGFGHIVNIGSTAGKDVYPNGNVYCATKHAVDALSQSMRIDLLPYGIKVTAVNPGACETEFALVRFNGDREKAAKVYDGFTPLTPNDVASTIYFACTLPAHVCINDLTLTCLQQANAHHISRNTTN
jgi:NADP-dependent 3-hydroxy acid dehydrogenase YdfG